MLYYYIIILLHYYIIILLYIYYTYVRYFRSSAMAWIACPPVFKWRLLARHVGPHAYISWMEESCQLGTARAEVDHGFPPWRRAEATQSLKLGKTSLWKDVFFQETETRYVMCTYIYTYVTHWSVLFQPVMAPGSSNAIKLVVTRHTPRAVATPGGDSPRSPEHRDGLLSPFQCADASVLPSHAKGEAKEYHETAQFINIYESIVYEKSVVWKSCAWQVRSSQTGYSLLAPWSKSQTHWVSRSNGW